MADFNFLYASAAGTAKFTDFESFGAYFTGFSGRCLFTTTCSEAALSMSNTGIGSTGVVTSGLGLTIGVGLTEIEGLGLGDGSSAKAMVGNKNPSRVS